jgi:hypothetical protein
VKSIIAVFAISLLLAMSAQAEINGCNAERVKATILGGTFLKWRAAQLDELKKFVAVEFQSRPPYVCPPFVPPNTGSRSSFSASPNNAPYRWDEQQGGDGQVKRPSAPLTAQDYLDAHRRACAARTAQAQDEERLRKQQFEERREGALKSLSEVGKAEASIVNVRQRDYDKANDIRFCAAEFEYKLYQPGISAIVYSSVCERSFSYKIEPLLDKPDAFYVSWICE